MMIDGLKLFSSAHTAKLRNQFSLSPMLQCRNSCRNIINETYATHTTSATNKQTQQLSYGVPTSIRVLVIIIWKEFRKEIKMRQEYFEYQHFTLELLGRHFDGFTFWQVVSQWVGWDLVVLKKVNGCLSEKTGRGRGWPSWSQSSRLPCGRAREGGGWCQAKPIYFHLSTPPVARCRWWWPAVN